MSKDLKVNELLPVYTKAAESRICITHSPPTSDKTKFLLQKKANIYIELTLRQRLFLSKQK